VATGSCPSSTYGGGSSGTGPRPAPVPDRPSDAPDGTRTEKLRTTETTAVEVATTHPPEVDQLDSALSEHTPATGTSARGWLELRTSLPAPGLTYASATTLPAASAAADAEGDRLRGDARRRVRPAPGTYAGTAGAGRAASVGQSLPRTSSCPRPQPAVQPDRAAAQVRNPAALALKTKGRNR